MAIRLNTALSSFWYTPKAEQGADSPSRFLLKPLNGEQFGVITGKLDTTSQGGIIYTGEAVSLCLDNALLDWDQVANEKGEPLKCKGTNFKYLPFDLRLELFFEVYAKSNLSKEEIENLG